MERWKHGRAQAEQYKAANTEVPRILSPGTVRGNFPPKLKRPPFQAHPGACLPSGTLSSFHAIVTHAYRIANSLSRKHTPTIRTTASIAYGPHTCPQGPHPSRPPFRSRTQDSRLRSNIGLFALFFFPFPFSASPAPFETVVSTVTYPRNPSSRWRTTT